MSVEELITEIERTGDTPGFDLHGCRLDDLDMSPEALRPHLQRRGVAQPHRDEVPWLSSHEGIRLVDAHLEFASIMRAKLPGADLRGAQLQAARLTWSDLREANFRTASLNRAELAVTDARGASFIGSNLSQAELTGADLRNADFRECNLEETNLIAAGLGGVLWYAARLRRTNMRREQLGSVIGDELLAKGLRRAPLVMTPNTLPHFDQANEAYLALKNNFRELGRYEDASWAYYKERQMEKAMHFPTTVGHRLIRQQVRHVGRALRFLPRPLRPLIRRRLMLPLAWFLFHGSLLLRRHPPSPDGERLRERFDRPRWLRNWVYELLTGYGERPLNPVIGGAIAMLAFAAGYFLSGAIGNLWDALVYSLATFATFNLADLQPHGRGVDIASSVEALLGIAVLALVVFTLGNRMSRS